jgi:DNA-binding Lrp family transcriptional regulator
MTVRSSRLPYPYDQVDATIVDALKAEGRMSVPVLAELVGVSRATAYSRFDRLVADGVISGFRAVVPPAKAGLSVAALVLINGEQGLWSETLQQLQEIAGVEWVGLTAGVFDFVALVRAADLTELRDVVLRSLRDIPGLNSTQTAIILDEEGVLA